MTSGGIRERISRISGAIKRGTWGRHPLDMVGLVNEKYKDHFQKFFVVKFGKVLSNQLNIKSLISWDFSLVHSYNYKRFL